LLLSSQKTAGKEKEKSLCLLCVCLCWGQCHCRYVLTCVCVCCVRGVRGGELLVAVSSSRGDLLYLSLLACNGYLLIIFFFSFPWVADFVFSWGSCPVSPHTLCVIVITTAQWKRPLAGNLVLVLFVG
jgi:hypothetical protein